MVFFLLYFQRHLSGIQLERDRGSLVVDAEADSRLRSTGRHQRRVDVAGQRLILDLIGRDSNVGQRDRLVHAQVRRLHGDRKTAHGGQRTLKETAESRLDVALSGGSGAQIISAMSYDGV